MDIDLTREGKLAHPHRQLAAIGWLPFTHAGDDLPSEATRKAAVAFQESWTAEQGLQHVSKDVKSDGTPRIVPRWVPDPETWDLCRQAWEMRVSGASYREIHEATRLLGSTGSYATFFRNRIYTGTLVYSGQEYPGFVPALVTEEAWEQVITRLMDTVERGGYSSSLAERLAEREAERSRLRVRLSEVDLQFPSFAGALESFPLGALENINISDEDEEDGADTLPSSFWGPKRTVFGCRATPMRYYRALASQGPPRERLYGPLCQSTSANISNCPIQYLHHRTDKPKGRSQRVDEPRFCGIIITFRSGGYFHGRKDACSTLALTLLPLHGCIRF